MMSKKKATMSLKDFHGGSIPSDLSLPSAPGSGLRPLDRGGYDRQTPWANPLGRPDQRLRPGSAGTARPFDDKSPFLSNSVRIGRNFEEDERKPLDRVSGPNRMAGDDIIHAFPSRMEPKADYSSGGRISNRPGSSQLSTSATDGSYAARFTEANRMGVHSPPVASSNSYPASDGSRMGTNHQVVHVSTGVSSSGTRPNAWGLKKDSAEQVKMSWSAPDAATKFARASALEKVSSGRWHMKQSLPPQPDVEVMEYPENAKEFHPMSNNLHWSAYDAMDVTVRTEFDDVKLARNVEKCLSVDDGIQGGADDSESYRRAGVAVFSDVKEKMSSNITDGTQHARNAEKFGGPPSPMVAESAERRKLNLLPRSKPLVDTEPPAGYKQAYQQPNDSSFLDNGDDLPGISSSVSPGIVVSDGGNQVVERPKLNLKPRSQPFEKLDGSSGKDRSLLFGGGRPRELVLKERGIPDADINNDPSQPTYRVKQDVPKTETQLVHATPARVDEKTGNIPLDRGIQKIADKRDHLVDAEKIGVQKRTWQSENRRSGRDFEKQQQHQYHPQERPPSPETWRKPVAQPKQNNLDDRGQGYGKTASAVDLALAFSRSAASDVKAIEHLSGQRGLASRDHVPFSRLMGANPRARINGF